MSEKLKYSVLVIGILALLGVVAALTSSLFDLGEGQRRIPPPRPVPRPGKAPVAESVVQIGEREPEKPSPSALVPPKPKPRVVETPVAAAIEEPVPGTNEQAVAALPFAGSSAATMCDQYPQAIKTRGAWRDKISYEADTSARSVKFTFLREELDPSGTHEIAK